MHPYIRQQLTGTRIADIRSQAERARLARTARRGRHATRPAAWPAAGPGALLHHVLPGTLAAQAPQGL